MTRTHTSRRAVLEGIGAAVAVSAVPVAGTARAASGWTAVETPTESTLSDVEYTAAGAYAAGAGGIVIRRTDTGWETVLDGGPSGNGNDLYGADVTDDGEVLWFVGSSGAIGAYDVTTGTLQDYSAPNDVTNNFNDVSVTGSGDDANVYVAGDSGKLYYSFDGGETFDDVTPGSGSNLNAVDFHGERAGHVVDGNQTVFETTDGASWDRLGIENANYNFYGVDADGASDVWVSGGGGTIYHWNGAQWRRDDTGDAALRDIEVAGGDAAGLAVGGGGKVFALGEDGWTAVDTPTGENLQAVVRGTPDIAVGAGGTVIER